jgi:hypothetical protein
MGIVGQPQPLSTVNVTCISRLIWPRPSSSGMKIHPARAEFDPPFSVPLGAAFQEREHLCIASRVGVVDEGDQEIGERCIVPKLQL